jgi:dTDP-4-amino-4,6-dideoxygalactose transaminase
LSSILVDAPVAGWSSIELLEYLEELNIESRPLWKPMHLQPLYREARFVGGHVAERLFETGLALPSGSAMSDSDMGRVLDAISAFLGSR